MGHQKEVGNIWWWVEPLTRYLFMAQLIDIHLNGLTFPTSGGDKMQLVKKWVGMSYNWSSKSELEVQRITHLKRWTNQLPDKLTDLNMVTS